MVSRIVAVIVAVRVVGNFSGTARVMQPLPRVERTSLAIAGHLRDVLIVDIFEVRHFRDVVFKPCVSLNYISCALLVPLAVSFTEGILLWCDISVLARHDHNDNADKNEHIKKSYQSKDHVWCS